MVGKLLKELLQQLRKEDPKYDEHCGTLTKVGVSWPGPKFDDQLLSSYFGNKKYDVVKTLICETLDSLTLPWVRGAETRTLEIDIRPDAEVIALAEQRHPLGALPNTDSTKPAMILNIGSGICAGFNAAAKTDVGELGEELPKRELATALGRWLRIDVVKGGVTPDWQKVFDEASPARPLETVDDFHDDKGTLPRLSATLSTLALALRLLRQLAHAEAIRGPGPEAAEKTRESKEFLKRLMPDKSAEELFEKPMQGDVKPLFDLLTAEPYGTAYARFKILRQEVYRFALFDEVSRIGSQDDGDNGSDSDAHRVVRDFVIEVAGDLAATLNAIEKCAQTIGIKPETTRYCVLTGSIGRDFGRDEDDLLLRTLRTLRGVDHRSDQAASRGQMVRTADPTAAVLRRVRCADRPVDGRSYDQGPLRQLLPNSHIERTNLAVAAEAEIEAFD